MKRNFKKSLAILLAVFCICSSLSVIALAARTAKFDANGGELAEGVTTDMLTTTSDNKNKVVLPGKMFVRYLKNDDGKYLDKDGNVLADDDIANRVEEYVQTGWATSKTATTLAAATQFGKTYTLPRNNFTFYAFWEQQRYELTYAPGSYANPGQNEQSVVQYGNSDEGGNVFTLNGPTYVRDNYVQQGWVQNDVNEGVGLQYLNGANYTMSKNKGNGVLYPYWVPKTYTVSFVKDSADVTGDNADVTGAYDAIITAPGKDQFKRENYLLLGWSTVPGGTSAEDVELALGGRYTVEGDITFYPVWRNVDLTTSIDKPVVGFGYDCIDYDELPDAQLVNVTNLGNVEPTLVMPASNYFTVTASKSTMGLGETITLSIVPKAGLPVGQYVEDLVITSDEYDGLTITVTASFSVYDHVYPENKYKYDGNATYSSNGTETALCTNGCGTPNTRECAGSQLEYGEEYNTVIGLESVYTHHRTVSFTAYGSGLDDYEEVLTTRFVPVTWYVNDDFNGEFANGNYTAVYTHTVFGDYTLSVTYVEETLVEVEEGVFEWQANGNISEKSFDYSVTANADEEQEIVMPNTIVNIIFALFQKLFSLIGDLFG